MTEEIELIDADCERESKRQTEYIISTTKKKIEKEKNNTLLCLMMPTAHECAYIRS